MGPETRRFVLIVTCLTGAIACSITSLQHRGQHICNAVHVVDEFFITTAACLGRSDPLTLAFVSSKSAQNVRCNVTQYQRHPKHVFLSHNLAVVQAKCEPEAALESRTSIRDAKSEDLLTLLEFGGSLQEVCTRLKLDNCSVCQNQYEVFDCKRQMCVNPAGKAIRKRSILDVLAGIALNNPDVLQALLLNIPNPSTIIKQLSKFGDLIQTAVIESSKR